ncbi:MAG: phage major capsid protein, partial [Dehalococcoidia bacterium]|nr:phage major capsid protein [Dehalococcoidia bacterium]
MAITLTEAAKLSTDILLTGIMETIVKDSPVLQRLPFIEVVGNGLTYNQELTLPVVAWYDENAQWGSETAPTFTKVTAGLEILGANADVDNFIKATRSNIQDVEAAV